MKEQKRSRLRFFIFQFDKIKAALYWRLSETSDGIIPQAAGLLLYLSSGSAVLIRPRLLQPAFAPLGTGFSGTAKTGVMPS